MKQLLLHLPFSYSNLQIEHKLAINHKIIPIFHFRIWSTLNRFHSNHLLCTQPFKLRQKIRLLQVKRQAQTTHQPPNHPQSPIKTREQRLPLQKIHQKLPKKKKTREKGSVADLEREEDGEGAQEEDRQISLPHRRSIWRRRSSPGKKAAAAVDEGHEAPRVGLARAFESWLS